MVLVFDIGNTYCKVILFDDKKIILKKKYLSKENYEDKIVSCFSIFKKIKYIVVGSVYLKYKKKIIYIAKKLKVKFKILTSLDFKKTSLKTCCKFEEIGLDILSFSYFIYLKKINALCISYGTLTFASVIFNGSLEGVIISPPFYLSNYNTFFNKASLINDYKIKFFNDFKFGINTNEAISYGLIYFYFGYINFLWELNSQKYKLDKLYLCGGGIQIFSDTKFFSILKKKLKTKVVNDDFIIAKGYLFLFQWLKINSKL